MSVIKGIIGQQSYEKVHDRIGEILLDELAGQAAQSYDEDLEFDVIFKERDIPFGQSEVKMLNVYLDRSQYVHQTLVQNDGIHRFVIECTFKGAGNDEVPGDTVAMTKVQKVLGKCRGILEHTSYKTLGFAAPFIHNRHVEEMFFGKPIRQDATHVCIGRMVFVVKVSETNGTVSAVVASEFETTVKLAETDIGYYWILEQTYEDGFNYKLNFDL